MSMTEKEVTSCIQTIELLKQLAYNIHGVMDVVDDRNCKKIIDLLKEQRKAKVAFMEDQFGNTATKCDNCGLYLEKAYSRCPKCQMELDWNSCQS